MKHKIIFFIISPLIVFVSAYFIVLVVKAQTTQGGVGGGAFCVSSSTLGVGYLSGSCNPPQTSQLNVVGLDNSTLTGSLTVTNAAQSLLFFVRGDGYVSVGFNPASTTATLYVNGNENFTGSLTASSFNGPISAANVTSDVFARLQTPGPFAFPQNLGVGTSSQVSLPQALSVYGGAYFSGNVGIGVSTTSDSFHISNSSSTNAFLVTSGGKIGIGTSTPSYALDIISGGFRSSATSTISPSLGIGTNSPLSTLDVSGNLAIGSYAGSNAAPSNGLIVSGNVGIGTSTPITQLHVTGSVPSGAVGSVGTNSGPYSVYVQGRYAYVVNNGSSTLQIFDVSNPASPTSVGSVGTGSSPWPIYVQGRYAYVVNYNSSTLQIFDVSNPASPVSVGSAGTGSNPISVYVQGRYAYVINNISNTLQIFDVSNPASPVSVGSVGTGTWPNSVYVQGRYAYVVNFSSNTLQIFDVSNPASPTSVGSVGTGSSPYFVYVQGRYAYVVNSGSNTLQIFDISNPAIPASVGSVGTGSYPYSVYVQGRYAYVANAGGNTLQIFDVSNPASPTNVGSVGTGSYPYSVYVQGRYVYVVNSGSNTLQIFDIGGSYIQQLETGGLETGTGQVRTNFTVNNDLDVRGGINVGSGGIYSAGDVSASGNLGTPWTNVTFGTGWSNYGAPYQNVQYQKFGDLVFIRGLANSGTNSWSTSPTIFTLPAGFRPPNRIIFDQIGNSNAAVRVDIDSASGNVFWWASGAGSGWIDLDNIVFKTQ